MTPHEPCCCVAYISLFELVGCQLTELLSLFSFCCSNALFESDSFCNIKKIVSVEPFVDGASPRSSVTVSLAQI